jgi:succinyl-CoA synthetase beta subunit
MARNWLTMACLMSAIGPSVVGCGAATGVFDVVGAADDSGATFDDMGGNSRPDAGSDSPIVVELDSGSPALFAFIVNGTKQTPLVSK